MPFDALISAEQHGTLPDVVKAEYKKREDGMFLLQVNEVSGFGLENVTGIKKALSTERKLRETAEAKVSQFKDIDAEAARDALAKVAEMDGWDKDTKTKELVEQATRKLSEKHKTELTQKEQRETQLMGALEGALIESAATAAIVEHSGNVDLLLPIVRKYAKVEEKDGKFEVRVLDDDGTNRITSKTGSTDPMGIGDFVSTVLKTDKRYQPAFVGSQNSGAGVKPKGGKDTSADRDRREGDAPATLNPVERLRQAREQAAQTSDE